MSLVQVLHLHKQIYFSKWIHVIDEIKLILVPCVRKSISHLTLILGLRRKIFSLNKFSNLVAHACECGSSLLNRTSGVQRLERIYFFSFLLNIVVYFVNETIRIFKWLFNSFCAWVKKEMPNNLWVQCNYRKVLDLDDSSKSYSFLLQIFYSTL